MAAPLIGISCYREPADWGAWTQVPADLLPAAYADAVTVAGGVPVLLPPVLTADSAAAALSRLDGLIIGGGADLDPAIYDATPGPHTAGWRADRDSSEGALLTAADGTDLPILGICRGMQMMAVHAGGTLAQHVPDLVGHQGHSPADGVYGRTSVEIAPTSQLAGIVGDRVTVPCHHHQSVDAHPGYVPVARAADGLLEGMEALEWRFRLAVQWHPEVGDDMSLFRALVAATR